MDTTGENERKKPKTTNYLEEEEEENGGMQHWNKLLSTKIPNCMFNYQSVPLTLASVKVPSVKVPGVEALRNNQLGFQGVEEYAKHKISPYFSSSIGTNKGVVIIACNQPVWEELKKLLAINEEHLVPTATEKKTRKPTLYELDDCYIMRTPPGEGHALIYAQSLLLLGIVQPEQLLVYVVPEIYEQPEAFRVVYNLDNDKLRLREAVDGASVILGLGNVQTQDARFREKFRQGQWKGVDFGVAGKTCWLARVYTKTTMKKKVCFFEWNDSFLGEPSEMLVDVLLQEGAVEILHVGCKVGTLVSPKKVNGEVWCPREFVLVSNLSNHDQCNTEIYNVSNCFVDGPNDNYQSGPHVTVRNPFEEFDGSVLNWASKGATTVDNEGAFMAGAIQKFNNKSLREGGRTVRFGAIYFASDYVLRAHEKLPSLCKVQSNSSIVGEKLNESQILAREAKIENRLYDYLTQDHFRFDVNTANSWRVASQKLTCYVEGTRLSLLNEMKRECGEKQMVALVGNPGMGKSVIMSVLMKDPSLKLGGAHFFVHDDSPVASFKNFVLSLCNQLCNSSQAFCREFQKQVGNEREDSILSQNPEQILANYLFAVSLKFESSDAVVIILDALDECDEASTLIRTICKSISQRKVAKWLRFIVSVRNIGDYVRQMKDCGGKVLTLEDDELNKEDLAKYLHSKVSKDLDPLIIKTIIDISGGLFLWFQHEVDHIKDLSNKGTLSMEAVRELPPGIKDGYGKYFSKLFKALGDKEKYRNCVALAVLAPREPIPEQLWRRALGYPYSSYDDKASYKDFRLIVQSLLIFESPQTMDGVIRLPHKSMKDWLIGEEDGALSMPKYRHLAVEVNKEHHRTLGKVAKRFMKNSRNKIQS